jgi:hypothetical protein
MSSAPQPAKLPPFSFAAESVAFERRWLTEIPRRFHALQTQFIPERNMLHYLHGSKWTFAEPRGDDAPSEFKEHREDLVVSAEARVNVEIERLSASADELARKFAAGASEMMFQKVEEATNQTGNVVTWKKQERNAPAVFLELLRKVQFGVREDGSPSLPSFVNFDPAFLAELQEHQKAHPEFAAEVERIKVEKINEALGRDAERKAKFKRRA